MDIQFCFFHIEKCAGSSIRNMLFDYFSKLYDKKYILGVTDDINLMTLENLTEIQKKQCKVLLCHCNFNQEHITDSFSNTCFSITCVREPMSRWLSHYYYFMKPTRKFSELSDDEINKLLYSRDGHLSNLLKLRLSGYKNCLKTALTNLTSINCILIFEQLSTDIKLLENALNKKTNTMHKLTLPFFNISHSYSSDDYMKIQKFSYFFKDDIQLYNHIVNLSIQDRFK
jgi:hypothetical protein